MQVFPGEKVPHSLRLKLGPLLLLGKKRPAVVFSSSGKKGRNFDSCRHFKHWFKSQSRKAK